MSARLLLPTILIGGVAGALLPSGREAAGPAATATTAQAPAVATPPAATFPAEIVLERKADGHFYADALVNGQLVRFLVDTGATTVALTMDDARHAGLAFSPAEFTVVGRGVSGPVKGKPVMLRQISIGHKDMRDVRAVILEDGMDVSLLGQSALARIGTVRIADDRMTLR